MFTKKIGIFECLLIEKYLTQATINSVVLLVNLHLFILTASIRHLKENSTSIKGIYSFAHQQCIMHIWNCSPLAMELNPSPRNIQTSGTMILCWCLGWPKADCDIHDSNVTTIPRFMPCNTMFTCACMLTSISTIFLSQKFHKKVGMKTALRCCSYSLFHIQPHHFWLRHNLIGAGGRLKRKETHPPRSLMMLLKKKCISGSLFYPILSLPPNETSSSLR